MKKEKYNTCCHAIDTGNMAVRVTPGCPHATKIRGVLVSSKDRCRNCASWEKKEER